MSNKEYKIVFKNGVLRISLYKAIFFIKILEALRSGKLVIKYSYKYKAFDDYLISSINWTEKKEKLLNKSGINKRENLYAIKKHLEKKLNDQLRETNENIIFGVNKNIIFNKHNQFKIKTFKERGKNIKLSNDIFPKNRFIPTFEVLSAVEKFSCFIDAFEHF